MKKILAIIALLVATLVPVMTIQSPATAATCGADQTRVGPVTTVSWEGTKWKFNSVTRYDYCTSSTGNYYRIDWYGIDISHVSGAGYCNGGTLNGWKANPNSLGGWNPGEKTIDCSGTRNYYAFTWGGEDGLAATRVYEHHDSTERCINTTVTYNLELTADWSFDVGTECFNP